VLGAAAGSAGGAGSIGASGADCGVGAAGAIGSACCAKAGIVAKAKMVDKIKRCFIANSCIKQISPATGITSTGLQEFNGAKSCRFMRMQLLDHSCSIKIFVTSTRHRKRRISSQKRVNNAMN
jgi:hypothetical protein